MSRGDFQSVHISNKPVWLEYHVDITGTLQIEVIHYRSVRLNTWHAASLQAFTGNRQTHAFKVS